MLGPGQQKSRAEWVKRYSFWREFDRVTRRVERTGLCSEEEEGASQARGLAKGTAGDKRG